MSRFYDFDAARAERLAEPPPTMVAFGETVELPRSVPAAIHLTGARLAASEVTLAVLVELLGYLVGPERINRWLAEHALEEDDVRDLYYGALRTIQIEDPDPEAEPPETGDPDGQTSPSTGAPSSPTSAASTTST